MPIFHDPKHDVGRVKDASLRPGEALAENRRWSQDQSFLHFRFIRNLINGEEVGAPTPCRGLTLF